MADDGRDRLEMEGNVSMALGNGLFRVKVGDHEVLCTLSGKMRMNNIKIIEGDRVKFEVSPYDLSKGRIVFRDKQQ